MWLGNAGNALLWVSLIASFLTMGCYAFASKLPKNQKLLLSGRLAYTLTAVSMIAVFGVLAMLVAPHVIPVATELTLSHSLGSPMMIPTCN